MEQRRRRSCATSCCGGGGAPETLSHAATTTYLPMALCCCWIVGSSVQRGLVPKLTRDRRHGPIPRVQHTGTRAPRTPSFAIMAAKRLKIERRPS